MTWYRVHIDTAITPYIEREMTKNNKKRFVPLSDDMVELLKDLRRTNQVNSKHVFLSTQGKPLQSVKRPFETAPRGAGILNFKFHDLCHTFA